MFLPALICSKFHEKHFSLQGMLGNIWWFKNRAIDWITAYKISQIEQCLTRANNCDISDLPWLIETGRLQLNHTCDDVSGNLPPTVSDHKRPFNTQCQIEKLSPSDWVSFESTLRHGRSAATVRSPGTRALLFQCSTNSLKKTFQRLQHTDSNIRSNDHQINVSNIVPIVYYRIRDPI